MKPSEQFRFDSFYQQHLNVLKLQGKADVTIDAYSRAVRRVSAFFDCYPDPLDQYQLRDYFLSLVQGFRRVCDYGFLHGNAKQTLKRVQWALRVHAPKIKKRERPKWYCKHCGGEMQIISTHRRRLKRTDDV